MQTIHRLIENNANLFGVAVGDGTNWAWPDLNAQLTTNAWNHMVAVREGDQATMYLDGAVVGTGALASGDPVVPATSNFRIGNWVLGGREFNGIVDEAFLINEALSADQIQNIRDNGLLGSATAVSPAGKAAIAWGRIKTGY